jgi:type I restriction enzyme S subunit
MRNWITKKLEEVANLTMGQSPVSSSYTTDGNGIEFLQGCGEFGEKFPDTALRCNLPKKIAKKDSILFSVRAPVGKINFADKDYCIGRGLAAIFPKNINQGFLYQTLLLRSEEFRNISQGSTFEAINSQELKQFKITFPDDKEEQTAIAEVLSKIDTAIEKTQKLIEKQKHIKQGLMQDLLTKGIDEQGNIRNEKTHRFKDSPLGRIPEEWEIKTLSELVFANRPIVYGILMPGNNFDDGVPVIKVKDIKNGKIDSENLLLTNPKIDNQYQRSKTKTNDLLLTIRGTVGRTAFVPKNLEGANITQDTARISIEDGVPSFIRTYLEMPAPKLFIEIHTLGVAVQGINLGDVRRIPVAFQPINEQKEISEKLDLFERRITKEINYLAKLNLTKTGLMQDLLSGKKSVESLMSE